ncbi:hypothetical protein JD844_000279 [Phrynosoma platyrhinos]|uniref:THAP domain-containing protein 11 n=1 Tax=Phrynosoma platyrhinos TaxID=52577 RepID=A0ABQ7SQG0_PHRPL|nr:hypothetical protein JD844_000279 [Phrynosoma platyrhinos]
MPGFTCCVPGCYNNSHRDKALHFYTFPKDAELRRLWLKNVSRAGVSGCFSTFQPTTGHRVCSEHFPGGRKSYLVRNLPFSYQRPTTSMAMDSTTPRTLFKKVLQTQKCFLLLPSTEELSCDFFFFSNLEISLPDSAPKEKCHISRLRPRLKKIRLSEFERGVNNQLDSNTGNSVIIGKHIPDKIESLLLDTKDGKCGWLCSYVLRSPQISFRTPAPLQSAGRKGLIRRPKNYRAINVKDFEGGIEQNLLHTKECEFAFF